MQIVTGATQRLFAGAYVPVAHNGSHLPATKSSKRQAAGEVSNGNALLPVGAGPDRPRLPYAIEDGIFILGTTARKTLAWISTRPSALTTPAPSLQDHLPTAPTACRSPAWPGKRRSPSKKSSISLSPRWRRRPATSGNTCPLRLQNPELCPRYTLRMVKMSRLDPPRWMRERLRACGVRPINNIVDITNYVMLEYGHARLDFNYSKAAKSSSGPPGRMRLPS